MSKIEVHGQKIRFYRINDDDYICITDIAKYKESIRTDDLIRNWLRNRNTLEFMGIWERLNNQSFNPVEFDGIKNQAGLNSFVLTPRRWIEKTNAVGIISKPGRYGGTYAHKDIAFEFASWISVEFKLYLIKEFQRLKQEENQKKHLDWDLRRNLAKINYDIHTDAIKNNLIPPRISKLEEKKIYADEADVLNKALFGLTAKEWKFNNPKKKGTIRDYANIIQLVCLSNLESINAVLIKDKITQFQRLIKLNEIAIYQMGILIMNKETKRLNEHQKLYVTKTI